MMVSGFSFSQDSLRVNDFFQADSLGKFLVVKWGDQCQLSTNEKYGEFVCIGESFAPSGQFEIKNKEDLWIKGNYTENGPEGYWNFCEDGRICKQVYAEKGNLDLIYEVHEETEVPLMNKVEMDFDTKPLFKECKDLGNSEERVSCSEELLASKIQEKVYYPVSLLEENITGEVIARIEINEEGDVIRKGIVKKLYNELDKIALIAIKDLNEFHPAVKNGIPVKGFIDISIDFKPEMNSVVNDLFYTNDKVDSKSYNTGKVYHIDGNYNVALTYYNKAISESPEYKKIYLARGLCYRELYDSEKAYNDLKIGISKYSSDQRLYVIRAEMATDIRRFKEARVDLEKALEEDSSSYKVHRGFAYLNLHEGNFETALVNINKALEFYPSSAVSLTMKSQILMRLQRMEEAEEGLEKAFEIDTLAETYLQRAYLRGVWMNDYMGAVDDIKSAQKISKNPKFDIEANRVLGRIYTKEGSFQQALNYFQVSIELSDEIETQMYKAWCLHLMGDNDKALNIINNVIQKEDFRAEAYKIRAYIYDSLGSTEDACNDIDRAYLLKYKVLFGMDLEVIKERSCSKK